MRTDRSSGLHSWVVYLPFHPDTLPPGYPTPLCGYSTHWIPYTHQKGHGTRDNQWTDNASENIAFPLRSVKIQVNTIWCLYWTCLGKTIDTLFKFQ